MTSLLRLRIGYLLSGIGIGAGFALLQLRADLAHSTQLLSTQVRERAERRGKANEFSLSSFAVSFRLNFFPLARSMVFPLSLLCSPSCSPKRTRRESSPRSRSRAQTAERTACFPLLRARKETQSASPQRRFFWFCRRRANERNEGKSNGPLSFLLPAFRRGAP